MELAPSAGWVTPTSVLACPSGSTAIEVKGMVVSVSASTVAVTGSATGLLLASDAAFLWPMP
jgi:hypothetical protein